MDRIAEAGLSGVENDSNPLGFRPSPKWRKAAMTGTSSASV